MIVRILTLGVYLLVGLLMVCVECVARFGAHPKVPTLAATFRWAMRRRSTQLGFLLAWWWLGWHFITAS